MKKSIILLMHLTFMLKVFSQDTTTHELTRADYLRKSKSQKTAAWILLGSGVGMAVAGLSIFKLDYSIGWGDDPTPSHVDNTGSELLLLGGLAGIISGSIMLSSAHKNKQRAAALSFSNQRIPLLQQNGIVSKMQPTIRLRIPL